ncbi:hypothetical protein [Microbacterium sp. ZXX196]|uniref:hypothetical protein n=1 Tax=Microbacterium sp. ZXX196 TaxID=2609291 RepID=UPI0012B750AC|nr:hypothetical protein [Microbacterium sp. ZXX196]MTE24458.1 hypothetical protein [Microbacterium sp. ZXX196]
MSDMCWGPGSYVTWPTSPEGRRIAQFAPSASDVVAAAQEMVDIALDMTSASRTLQAVAESEDGQQGQAVDKLRELVGDTWEILGQSGSMYYATASAIRTYGRALENSVAEDIDSAYTLASEKWEAYDTLPGDRDGDLTASPSDDDPNAAGDAQDNREKYDAFQEWMNAANAWDACYNDWEDAWNTAIDAIEDAHEDGPADGWGDVLKVVYGVLTVVALVVGVLALIFGGPFILAGMIVGGLIAVVSLIRYVRGEVSLGTLLLDIAGAVPLGKLGALMAKIDLGMFAKLGGTAGNLVDGSVARVFPELVFPGVARGAGNAVTSAAAPYLASIGDMAMRLQPIGPYLEVADPVYEQFKVLYAFNGTLDNGSQLAEWLSGGAS